MDDLVEGKFVLPVVDLVEDLHCKLNCDEDTEGFIIIDECSSSDDDYVIIEDENDVSDEDEPMQVSASNDIDFSDSTEIQGPRSNYDTTEESEDSVASSTTIIDHQEDVATQDVATPRTSTNAGHLFKFSIVWNLNADGNVNRDFISSYPFFSQMCHLIWGGRFDFKYASAEVTVRFLSGDLALAATCLNKLLIDSPFRIKQDIPFSKEIEEKLFKKNEMKSDLFTSLLILPRGNSSHNFKILYLIRYLYLFHKVAGLIKYRTKGGINDLTAYFIPNFECVTSYIKNLDQHLHDVLCEEQYFILKICEDRKVLNAAKQ